MTPLLLVCTVLEKAEDYLSKSGSLPSKVLIPHTYTELLASPYCVEAYDDGYSTMQRILNISWVRYVDVQECYKSINVE